MKYRHFPAAALAAGLLFCTLFSGLTAYADDKKGELTQKQTETRQEYEAAQSALEELQNEQTQTESEVAALTGQAAELAGQITAVTDAVQNAQTVLDERQAAADAARREADATEYYTLWSHQIKTPLAAMRLLLQESPDIPGRSAFAQELFKAEQYVDMVLGYLRIGSIHADLSPQEVPLEALVRESVKKVSTLFIHQKSTTLQISSLPGTVLTDKKWFSFVLEQILTNAAKYTPRGTVRTSPTSPCPARRSITGFFAACKGVLPLSSSTGKSAMPSPMTNTYFINYTLSFVLGAFLCYHRV